MHRGGTLTAWFPRRTRPAYQRFFNAAKESDRGAGGELEAIVGHS